MANAVVLKFPEADGAYRMLDKLEDLQKQELIHIEDAAVVSWPEGKRKPRTRHLRDRRAADDRAVCGSFVW